MKKLLVLFLAVMLVAPFVVSSAMAAGGPVKITGNARFNFGRLWRDTQDSAINNIWGPAVGTNTNQVWGGAPFASALADSTDTDSFYWGYGEMTFAFAPTDNITGVVMMDVWNNDSVGNVRAKLWYGVWNAGWAKITVGRQYTVVGQLGGNNPIFAAWVNDLHMTTTNLWPIGEPGHMVSCGCSYAGRQAGVKFDIPVIPGGTLSFGVFEYEDTAMMAIASAGAAGSILGTVDLETDWPKFEIGYLQVLPLGGGTLLFKASAGYQTYEIDNSADPNAFVSTDYDINSWAIVVAAAGYFGPFSFGTSVWWSQNPDQYGFTTDGIVPGTIIWDGQNFDDQRTWGFHIGGTYKLNDMFSFQLGYGQSRSEEMQTAGTTDTAWSSHMYAQTKISFNPNVTLTLQVGRNEYNDMGTRTNSDGQETDYAVGEFRIDF
jgi:hypothetical protein